VLRYSDRLVQRDSVYINTMSYISYNKMMYVLILAGIRKAGIAGAIAAGVAVMYCAWNNGGLSLHRVNGWKNAA